MFWKLFLSNAAALTVALVFLVFGPLTQLTPDAPREIALLVLSVAALMLVNAAAVGQALKGMGQLKDALASGEEKPVTVSEDAGPEVKQVAAAYNAMLERLDAERTATARAALRAQEDERARLARDLHDEVGQNLTFLLLRLRMLEKEAPPEFADTLESAAEAARASLEEVRTLSRQLRPGVLQDLGLKPALSSLVDDADRLGLHATLEFSAWLGPDAERDLAVYRVVQEALTNVVKHADASAVAVTVQASESTLDVTVVDNGNGRAGSAGTGTTSMRERARLVGGTFRRTADPGTGTTVHISVPIAISTIADPPTRPIPRLSYFPPHHWDDPAEGGR